MEIKAVYAFCGNRLWVRSCGEARTCVAVQPSDPGESCLCEQFISFDGQHAVRVVDLEADPELAPGESLLGLRDLYDSVTPAEYAHVQRAFQILHWRRTHRFCSACGERLTRKAVEGAMACPVCKLDFFPRLNPVVITRVTRGNTILLARRAHGVLPFYSVIAGFVEAGETLEAAVSREIREEVGIAVKNIRYFASQPWPFPNNLMIGFTAEYASGEIQVDGEEIGEADWFSREAMPPIPNAISISRWMIDDFLKDNS